VELAIPSTMAYQRLHKRLRMPWIRRAANS
jgi:hypothetical protein